MRRKKLGRTVKCFFIFILHFMLVCIRYQPHYPLPRVGGEGEGVGAGAEALPHWEAKFKEERVGEGPDGHTYSHT
jgi:hypothetical protein